MGQSDVVIAYHQADVSRGHVYTAISKGFDSHCLPIQKSIYSVQDAGITGAISHKGVKGIGLRAVPVRWMGVLPRKHNIHDIFGCGHPDWAMSDMPFQFELQYKWDLSDFLGVKVRKLPDGSIEFVQAQSIDSTLEDQKLVDHGVGNEV
jgi:hypothetical protein